ncbi:AcrR family transcriptional regulator [Microbacterium sp. BE35]|uniref:TetR/AcrR family transcriptional regulator n=1 Tax=Microbacterium sp. BE35 TaxID=2817773 RepID=UPI00285F51CD|nr:helix-turn-helix domain-containing protein [Microbacterium sp. BE35]MDR7187412.1 AcrR family transcriptional regulator [Microbacterium sp. BE35]
MTLASSPVGRRERNKQQKLDRIMDAARELFAQYGVDEVTTQQIAEKADIGAGTLFLYAKTKGELLLLVQNDAYAAALDQGTQDAAAESGVVEAVLALIRPIVECNRAQVDNGRTYLREMVFGDPDEPRHREALDIVAKTEEVVATTLQRAGGIEEIRAAASARIVSAVMFLSMAASVNVDSSVDEIIQQIAQQLRVLLPPSTEGRG